MSKTAGRRLDRRPVSIKSGEDMNDKKSRILCIKRFLEEQTDEEHHVTVADILTSLEAQGVSASRQTITRDIQFLIEDGVDVVCNPGKPNGYFIGERSFELPEIKLLIDAVQASRFISSRKATALIRKLTNLASRYQSKGLRRSLYVNRQARPVDGKVYITVDLLNTAANTKKKITCKYTDWSADKKKFYKHGKDYLFSPYDLIWNNDHYYAVGWSDNHGKIITLRVDRIAKPRLTDEPAATKPEGYDVAFFTERVVQMYDGPVREITLVCENHTMKHIIDRFGEDVQTEILSAEHFNAYVKVPASPTFFAWVFTFKGSIKIIAEEDVAAQYREMVAAAMR